MYVNGREEELNRFYGEAARPRHGKRPGGTKDHRHKVVNKRKP